MKVWMILEIVTIILFFLIMRKIKCKNYYLNCRFRKEKQKNESRCKIRKN